MFNASQWCEIFHKAAMRRRREHFKWDGRTSLHTSTTLRTLSTDGNIDRRLHVSNYDHYNENHLAELTEQYRRSPGNITTDTVEYHLIGGNWVV